MKALPATVPERAPSPMIVHRECVPLFPHCVHVTLPEEVWTQVGDGGGCMMMRDDLHGIGRYCQCRRLGDRCQCCAERDR